MDISAIRSKPLETIISISLLIILLAVAGGVFSRQFLYDSDFYNTTAMTISAEAKTAAQPENLGHLLPVDFTILTNMETFDPDNLYNKINGRAELYHQFGFQKLNCQRFVSQKDENLWMELFVYDMTNPLNAMAVFGAQRRAGSNNLDLTRFAYSTENSVFLAKGKYYIEIIGTTESKQLTSAMLSAAGKLISETDFGEETIPELTFFPPPGLDNTSFKYYAADAFGFDGLNNIFTAKYKIDGESVTAFLSKRTDNQEAKALAESYYNFLIENGANKTETSPQFPGRMVNFYGTTEWVAVKDIFILGIHEADNAGAAEKLAAMLYKNLSRDPKDD